MIPCYYLVNVGDLEPQHGSIKWRKDRTKFYETVDFHKFTKPTALMPFTPAHPAIILPLIRSRYFSATGLVIGSLSPDFEYFFKMSVSSEYSHTLTGLFYFDLPVTLLLSGLFHVVVKKNFIYNLPLFFQKRFQDTLHFDFLKYLKDHWWIFVTSAFVGAGSHIFWDSFTHNNSFFVRTLPFYEGTYVPYEGVKYPLWYALQQISTVLGLTVVGIYVLAMKPVHTQPMALPKILYWFTLAIIAFVIVWVRFSIYPLDYKLGNTVVSSVSGLLVALVCCGFINFKNTTTQQESLNG